MSPPPPEDLRVAVFQVSALVDHVAAVERTTLLQLAGTEVAGSRRCSLEELQGMLASIGEFTSKAGGSASNVGRALASGFGATVQLVGTRGADEWGELYSAAMRRAGVNTERMRVLAGGATGRSAILTCEGERTMRTFMDPRVSTQIEDLTPESFSSCSWVFLSAYTLYSEGLLERAVQMAQQAGAKVVLDLASYEVVRSYHKQLQALFESGGVYFCICNEDEAQMLVRCSQEAAAAAAAAAAANPTASSPATPTDDVTAAGYPPDSSLPATALALLTRHCAGAVVTRGVLGCVATWGPRGLVKAAGGSDSGGGEGPVGGGGGGEGEGESGGDEGAVGGGAGGLIAVPAVPGVVVVDSTGAGDHFTAGFMYGLMSSQPLERCCEVGCLAGAAAVRVAGAELSPSDWQWFHARLHGDLAGDVMQDSSSAEEVAQELLGCYAMIGRLGRGAVYFGSARLAQGSPYWLRAVRLAERVAQLLGSPVWTGGGPGMMRAASEGGLRAGVPVGGIRISREAGTNVLTMEDYLSPGAAFTCKYMPTRKVALTDAGSRQRPCQRTAYLFLPGGLGTMDELFSILTLAQLGKLGSRLPVPLLIVNWDGFYDGLLELLQAFDRTGAFRASEVRQVMVARTNDEVLEYLATFYDLPVPDTEPDPMPEIAEEESEGEEDVKAWSAAANQVEEKAVRIVHVESGTTSTSTPVSGHSTAGATRGAAGTPRAAARAEGEVEEVAEGEDGGQVGDLEQRLEQLAAAETVGGGSGGLKKLGKPGSVLGGGPGGGGNSPGSAEASRHRSRRPSGGGLGIGTDSGPVVVSAHAVSAEEVLLRGLQGMGRK